MDSETQNRILLGKILGEIYRLQRRLEFPAADAATIYGLLHGFEHVINEELESVGFVSESQINAATGVLSKYFDDPEKCDKFNGFYDIESELSRVGVDRATAIRVLTYFKANDQFTTLIHKMNSSGSPIECTSFDLGEWDN